MTATNTMELLNKFCSKCEWADTRKHLLQIHRYQGFAIGTNGHILLRVELTADTQNIDEFIWPEKLQAMEQYVQTENFKLIPDLPKPKSCRWCDGSGTQAECTVCDGTGEFERGEYSYDCQSCNGAGAISKLAHLTKKKMAPDKIVPCFQCNGLCTERQDVKIADCVYDARYLSLLAELPGVRIAVNGDNAAYFKCDIGDGFLMPMRR